MTLAANEEHKRELPKSGGWQREDFFADDNFIGGHTVQGGVFLRKRNDLLWILVEKDATGEDLMKAFKRGLDAGLVGTSMPALVDLARFTGAVDWAAIRAVREMVPWGRGAKGKSRVAYVIRDGQFAALIKIVAVLFPRSTHRVFYKLEDAVAWLDSAQAPDAAEPKT